MIVLGTRPEAIKLAPVIKEFKRRSKMQTYVVSTGQHREMMDPILQFFEVTPDCDLDLMRPGQSLNDLLTRTIEGIKTCLLKEKPDLVMVQGDTLTSMATSLCAFLQKVPVAHVEAGLRTGDLSSPWPEEFNRRVTALTSHWHFAPTESNRQSLISESLLEKQIYVVGNTVMDALKYVSEKISSQPELQNQFTKAFPQIDSTKKLILLTAHRRENFGEPLRNIFAAMKTLCENSQYQILFPMHKNPEVKKAFESVFGLKVPKNLILTEPLDYVPFVQLMIKADLIVSDSGGIQEEALFLGKPVLILRDSTERIESVQSGICKLVGSDPTRIVHEASALLSDQKAYQAMTKTSNVYGDGNSSQKIVDLILKDFGA